MSVTQIPTVANAIVQQIGMGNVLAISGGRISLAKSDEGQTVVVLPVAHGYRVEVEYLLGADTYEVRRIFARGGKDFLKGVQTNVYCDQLGDAAYKASCYLDPWG
jgi:hypothetical protein